ncbi:MAG: hypothetical protein ABWZ25_13165 [Chitinophagaceae bacterium]
MRVSLFFLGLFILLLNFSGTESVAATTPVSSRFVANSQALQVSHECKTAVVTNADTDDQSVSVFSEDLEDEDINDLFARKFKLIARSDPAISQQTVFICFINRSKSASSFFGTETSRYIRQRVLRV